MPTYAVTYHYADKPEVIAEIRPIHREWLSQLLEEGVLLASGPKVSVPGALLIFKVDHLEELAQLLDRDPFDIAGVIQERVIEEWNPVFGPWS
ncbi:MAG: hypothetical protein RLY88_921 [Actinomycetota bacterium]|jgi:uncharacterized protein YciI